MNEDYLKLYSKEYHQSHLDWAEEESRIYCHYRDRYRALVQPKNEERVLEIGCSSGKTTLDFARAGCEVIAVDFDENAISLAQNLLRDKELTDQVTFLHCSADDPKIMDFEFDKVTMLDFVEHVPDSVIQNILTNLKKKCFQGEIFIYTPDRHHFTEILRDKGIISQDPTHVNLKSRKEWIDFFEKSGLKIVELKRETSHWPLLKNFESLFNSIPFVGSLMTRSISICGKLMALEY